MQRYAALTPHAPFSLVAQPHLPHTGSSTPLLLDLPHVPKIQFFILRCADDDPLTKCVNKLYVLFTIILSLAFYLCRVAHHFNASSRVCEIECA